MEIIDWVAVSYTVVMYCVVLLILPTLLAINIYDLSRHLVERFRTWRRND